MEDTKKPPLLRFLLATIALSAGAALLFWQLRHPFLRFSWSPLNYVGFIVGLALPGSVIVRCFQLRRWWGNVTAIVLVFPVLIVSLISGFIAFIGLAGAVFRGADLSFEQAAEVKWRSSWVRLYRLNGGATTGEDIVIRHERTILPGVILVRRIDTLYSCPDAKMRPTADGVSVRTASTCKSPLEERAYRLKTFLYF